MNASGLEVDHEQHQVAHKTDRGSELDAEEGRRGDRAPVRLQERLLWHGLSPHGRGAGSRTLDQSQEYPSRRTARRDIPGVGCVFTIDLP
jgi:hypothetical protein